MTCYSPNQHRVKCRIHPSMAYKTGWGSPTPPPAMGIANTKRDPFEHRPTRSHIRRLPQGARRPGDDLEYIRNVADASTDVDEDPIASAITYADRNAHRRAALRRYPDQTVRPMMVYGSRIATASPLTGHRACKNWEIEHSTPTPQQTTYPSPSLKCRLCAKWPQTLNLRLARR